MTLNFEAGYMHAVFPHATTRRILAARAGSIYAPCFRSRDSTTKFLNCNTRSSRRSCGKVGNAWFRVFQACRFWASVFSIAPCFPRRILVRGQIPQTAVRPFFVIFRSPPGDLALGIEQILEPAQVQTLFSQPSMEAFDVRVLRRLPWLNVD